MEEAQRDLHPVPTSLTAAVRRARVDEAERSEVLAELRGAEMARLEMLHDAIRPVLSEVPDSIDLFDAGIVPGEHPRLFIDMIGFVEMARDRRGYRFLQDTRHGRVIIVESERLELLVDAVTAYIARRLVEREKALAADLTIENAARAYRTAPPNSPPPAQMQLDRAAGIASGEVETTEAEREIGAATQVPRHRSLFARFIVRVVEILGSFVLGALAVAVLYAVLRYGVPYWAEHFGTLH